MNIAPTTIKLNKRHVKRASHVLASAFHDYPQSINLIPDGSKRRRLLPHIFECCVNYGLLYGEVHAVSDNLEGIAVWLPASDAVMSIPKMLRAGFLTMSRKIGPSVLYRLMRALFHSSSVLDKHARGTDWMLFQLAVNPFCRGRGHASALLRPMFSRMDRDGHSCCLDTHDEKNVNIYKRFGFEVVHSATDPRTNTGLWAMVRIPA